MKEMIQRIIDMDKKAREITDAAKKKSWNRKRLSLRRLPSFARKYSRARRRIQINKELENVILEQEWEKVKARYDSQLKNMNDLYARHGDEWVDTIVKRVLED